MTKIKILISSSPKLLSEVIRKLIGLQDDMDIIGEVVDPLKLIMTAREKYADAVLITPLKSNGEPRICRQLLIEHPKLLVVTLGPNSEFAFLYRSALPRLRFRTPSGQIILNLLRGGPIPEAC
ncbi:MAG: hypothetical protein K9M55_05315 [Candidatus Marinimicrobia bacterium]|nr:hypothetical protein [Candidatus Neomarinimicrobiota bacterium]